MYHIQKKIVFCLQKSAEIELKGCRCVRNRHNFCPYVREGWGWVMLQEADRYCWVMFQYCWVMPFPTNTHHSPHAAWLQAQPLGAGAHI
jgi:hypothetical protein